jgi:hypothetical protein
LLSSSGAAWLIIGYPSAALSPGSGQVTTLFVADENGELRAQEFAEATTVTGFLQLHQRDVITVLVDMGGVGKNVGGTEYGTNTAALAKFLVDVNHRILFRPSPGEPLGKQ